MAKPIEQFQTPPPVLRESDWMDMDLPFHIGSGRTLYSGLESADRLRLRLFKKGDQVVGRAWFGQGADGPPGHVHGGAIAYVLDEVMGSVCWANNYPTVAANLQFQYIRMTPLLADLVVEAKIVSVNSKRLKLEAELKLPTGETCVRSQGEFAILTYAKGEMLSKIIPDANDLIARPNLKWAKDDEG
ncbi:MAG TPA: PaaI family thioesterase [Bdellovibrionales bacterium]|nr:PaaI family thioesterase [Bdellovibrionales bacterium]